MGIDIEVCRTGDGVEEVEVVGQGTRFEEPLAEGDEHIELVVDPGEQDRLVEHGHARAPESGEGACDARVDLPGVVGVDHHDGAEPRPGEPTQQGLVHALRQDDG